MYPALTISSVCLSVCCVAGLPACLSACVLSEGGALGEWANEATLSKLAALLQKQLQQLRQLSPLPK